MSATAPGPGTTARASSAPAEGAKREATRLVFAALERAIAWAISDEAALIAARDVWNGLAGKVHDDEPLYEERAGAFLEWFALEHRGPGGRTPVERLQAERTSHAKGERDPVESAREANALKALGATHRSLFRVRERSGEILTLDDLWGGGAFRVTERRQLAGVGRGDVLDARLVADVEAPPDLLLTRIVCVHPREAEAAMRWQIDLARREGRDREALLFLLLRLRVRCERYVHTAPLRIYEAGETFKDR